MPGGAMKVKYLGPREKVGVAGFGPHLRGETKEYPDQVGMELVANSRRQRFERVPDPPQVKQPAKKKEQTKNET